MLRIKTFLPYCLNILYYEPILKIEADIIRFLVKFVKRLF